MANKEKIIQRIQLQIKENDVTGAIGDLKSLYDSFSGLIQGLLKNHDTDAAPIWHEYLHDLNHKFLFCIRSTITLIESFYYDLSSSEYHDMSSVFILNRSLIESYLTFFYCFKLPRFKEESL